MIFPFLFNILYLVWRYDDVCMVDRRLSQMMKMMLERPMWNIVCLSETIDNYCILLNGNNDFAKKTTWMMQDVSVFIILM